MLRFGRWLSLLLLALVVAGAVAACGDEGGSSSGPTDVDLGDVAGVTAVHINEVMPVNTASFEDEFGDFDDWIELYNASDVTVNLEGFYISDSEIDPRRQRLTADLRIPPRGVLVLWADDDEDQGSNHLSFNLGGTGEMVIISTPAGVEIERYEWTDAVGDESFARFPDGTGDFARCAHPTPNAVNGAACAQ